MESWGTEVNKCFSSRQSCRGGIRVGEALTKSIKSSAGLSDALLAMVATFLLKKLNLKGTLFIFDVTA